MRLPRPTVVCLLHTTRPSLQWFVKASMNVSTESKGLLRTGSDTDVAGTGSANTAKCITTELLQYYTHTYTHTHIHTYTHTTYIYTYIGPCNTQRQAQKLISGPDLATGA